MTPRSPQRGQAVDIDWEAPLGNALEASEPKPALDAPREDKKNYAERLSRNLARVVADGLRAKFPSVTPGAEGRAQEAPVGADRGRKRLDVKVWDDELGLVLSVSIKTYSFQDWDPARKRAGRYTKNIKRNDYELRAEADVVHRRQPYAVLFALMFMPITSCDDGDPTAARDEMKSSFAHAVLTLRQRTGRADADDRRTDLFEKVYIGLYEVDGRRRGAVRFFDVQNAPPRNGRPPAGNTLSFRQLLDEIERVVAARNQTEPVWGEAEVVVDEELDERE